MDWCILHAGMIYSPCSQDVESMWYFGSAEGSKFVEKTSACNVKRTWVNYGERRDWTSKEQGQGEEFLIQVS